jgi:hypothetical protein
VPLALSVVVGILGAFHAGVSAAHASHTSNRLGRLIVRAPCCAGVALQGSRVSIMNPPAGAFNIPNGTNGLSSVAVSQVGFIQFGVKLSNNVGYHTANCEQPQMAYWVEIFDENGARCHFIGTAVTSAVHKFSIQRQNPSWFYQVFMDGVPPNGQTIGAVPTNTGELFQVDAGGEITYRTGYSISGVNWWGRFAGTYETKWQRWNAAQGWYTIQGVTHVRQDPGWNFDTYQFPTVWWAWF